MPGQMPPRFSWMLEPIQTKPILMEELRFMPLWHKFVFIVCKK
jgi:hypothetical protein